MQKILDYYQKINERIVPDAYKKGFKSNKIIIDMNLQKKKQKVKQTVNDKFEDSYLKKQ